MNRETRVVFPILVSVIAGVVEMPSLPHHDFNDDLVAVAQQVSVHFSAASQHDYRRAGRWQGKEAA